MKISKTLTEEEIKDIKALNKICEIERIPNFDSSIFINPDLPCFYLEYKDDKLVCFVSLFYVDDSVIEIVGATHPLFRKQGYFTKLLNEAIKVVPHNLPILYQIPSSYVNKEELSSKGYIYHHGEEEIINKISANISNVLVPLNNQDVEAVANILADSFNRKVEEEIEILKLMLIQENSIPLVLKENSIVIGFIAISITFDVKTAYLFAFCVDKNYRSKGYGKKILSNLPFNPNGYVLRVNYNNVRAKKLYEQIGFIHLSSTEYYMKDN
jgi:ribosomal protein S18 acetylase RimI-like enzyme